VPTAPVASTLFIEEGMLEEGVHFVALSAGSKRVQTARDVAEMDLIAQSATQTKSEVPPQNLKDLHEVHKASVPPWSSPLLHRTILTVLFFSIQAVLEDKSNMQYFGEVDIGTPKSGGEAEKFKVAMPPTKLFLGK